MADPAAESAAPPAAASAASASGLTVVDKLNMSLDELTKLAKKEKRAKFLEQKKKKAEAQKKVKEAQKKAEQKAGGSAKQTKQPKQAQKGDNKKPAQAKPAAGGKATPSKADAAAAAKPPIVTGTPIIVSNLKEPLEQEQLLEIFGAAGTVKSAEMLKFNGKWHAAKVLYKLKADAEKAIKEFNGRLLDGEPMKVSLARKRVKSGDAKPNGNGASGSGSQAQSSSQPQKRQRKAAE